MIEPEYSATYMIEQSTPDARATDRWARDLIVKIERERSEAGLILGHDRASLRDANAELARLRHENERLRTLARDRDDVLAEWSKVRELVAAVVQSHDAPGGCRGPVGYTAMGDLAEWLAASDPEMGS